MAQPEERFWFRLAALWGCPVCEAKERCSSEEFTHWRAFYGIEPWGCELADMLAARICMTVAAWSGNGKKTQYSLDEFMFKFGTPPKRMSVADMKAIWGTIKQATDERAKQSQRR